jgi:hypothetical protein
MWISLALLAMIGGLAFKTIDPGKFRTLVLLLLSIFAVRIALAGFASR